MKIPYIGGDYKMLFKPTEQGNYVNDHSIAYDENGKIHLFGITSFLGGAPNERYFAHGVGENLDSPLKEQWRVIDRGELAWAPCVISEGGYYYMLYGPSPTKLSISFDMYEWNNYAVRLHGEPPLASLRDHFVLRLDDGSFLMYIVGTKDKKSCVSLYRSENLLDWYFEGYALTSGPDSELNPAWGAMESPFIIKHEGLYYLFITYTDCSKENYHNTMVFASENPRSFGIYNGENGENKPITKLFAHAPEIFTYNGQMYITTCGWNGYGVPHEGAVSYAPLLWK